MKSIPVHKENENTDRLIRYIVEHTHHEFGEQYFLSFVKHLAEALQVKGAWVTELREKEMRLRSLAFWFDDHHVEHYEYDLINTPCEMVINQQECFLVEDKVIELFPDDPDLKPLNAVSYMGYPLFDSSGKVIGHVAILHDEPLYPSTEQEAIFNLFVQRANAEFIRLKTSQQLEEKKQKLSSLINSVHDAILETDDTGFITLVNPAAEKLTGFKLQALEGSLIFSLFEKESGDYLRKTLKNIRDEAKAFPNLKDRKELYCIHAKGDTIPVEASLCQYKVHDKQYMTLILRDLKALKMAEQRIEIMEEKYAFNGAPRRSGIIGDSPVMLRLMEEVEQVAETDSTILLLGESGTGKEVFAKYIHQLSKRWEKPLIKVNCAAIPLNLIESEFFGHEKGAFTGAVSRRDGRFTLADGGALFLDEVGELPLEMQPKLLRVLQEGEFETVGGQRTLKVNVRIIAATNRNLEEMVKKGTFREDLYYRLNVIPLTLPLLKERGGDILLLADHFIRQFSRETGKPILPMDEEQINQLLKYPWPGNIRELAHVIERAVILSKGGKLDLLRFLPFDNTQIATSQTDPLDLIHLKVMSMAALTQLEKTNILKALELTKWKIAGPQGAAALLGIPPTTLNSKIKAFQLKKTHE
ncbi:sigma-54 interaction domain-containing protein [Pararhodonellum marinum]|uniref:sigma-54 interaction domain-containing protein n=1 Tax=Pararhodonellum marinum TaxID=2755358 RepID=UPI0018909C0A|nr:sigma 54-interacting transcriptional regulator [Pararhodonellum marinum]